MAATDMIRGRQVVAFLTNKSGGSVVAGDVVIMDGSNDESFTTTTSASSLSKIGVAQESIANNAQGRVLTAGYASLVNVNASATRANFLFTHTVAKQATSSATFAQGAFGRVIKAGTSPSALIYDETAQTAPSGGISAGTSFPGSPATNDLYRRTDINNWIFFYDGTRWRTTHSIVIPLINDISVGPWSATAAPTQSVVPYKGTYTLYLLTAECQTQFGTGTSDATHYWTVAVNWLDAATTRTSLGSFDTKTDTASNMTYHTIAINAVLSTSAVGFDVLYTKTSTPPNIAGTAVLIMAQIIAT